LNQVERDRWEAFHKATAKADAEDARALHAHMKIMEIEVKMAETHANFCRKEAVIADLFAAGLTGLIFFSAASAGAGAWTAVPFGLMTVAFLAGAIRRMKWWVRWTQKENKSQ
jgi:hypothetical protein